MAYVASFGFTDTPVEGVPGPLTFSRPVLNFQKDWRIKTEQSGKEVVLTNTIAPIEQPEKIRLGYQEISNIYNGSGIDPAFMATTRRGVSILSQLTRIKSVKSDTDATFHTDLPLSYQLLVKLPISEFITAQDFTDGVGRLLSSFFDTGLIDLARLNAILRGSLVPSGL